ncbi:MAG: hypothetical protein DYG93_08690 [Leptolyngbya sp. PLA2]|nr:hypothetical protein [Leptolyngbya sp.]MCE7971722.1 hypothetical protein [Leptolyngbya sp. PL-A2]MDL1904840.1 hypothetical protein [Synechococcales cyanobacterium CNB]
MEPWVPLDKAWMLGAFIGGGGGTAIGLLGATAGVLAPRGIGRRAVLGSMLAFALIGLGLVVAGVVGLIVGQPFHVWFWLLQPGVIFAFVTGPLIPVVARRYAQAEQRRLDAEALRRG